MTPEEFPPSFDAFAESRRRYFDRSKDGAAQRCAERSVRDALAALTLASDA